MNIKIKTSGVHCLIGDDYGMVFTALKKNLGADEAALFTERIPGYEYLQWVLPGEGWEPLSKCDPIMAGEVRSLLLTRKQTIMARFGANKELAQKILTVPDDSYVYYRPTVDGGVDIKLTVWGYQYPERINTGGISGVVSPNAKTSNVTIQFISNGNAISNKSFKINGYARVTDGKGVFEINQLPVGYQFDVDWDESSRHYVVKEGENNIQIDCTVYAPVEVSVVLDGQPCVGESVTIGYGNRQVELQTDQLGDCKTSVPWIDYGTNCSVGVRNEHQEKPLSLEVNRFDFKLETPVPIIPDPITPDPISPDPIQPGPIDPEQPLVDPVVPETPEEPEIPITPEPPVDNPEQPVIEPEAVVDDSQNEKTSIGSYLLGLLLILLLALLIAFTYYMGKGMLFG